MASVLVTGTSRGIGLETALVLGRAGHTVYPTMRNPDGAPALSQAAEKDRLPIKVLAMDVDSDSSVRETIGDIQKRFGPIDTLVNNAGIERSGSIEESKSTQLRYPIGPDAEGYLQWRASMTNQQWTDWGGADDDTWVRNVQETFGLDTREEVLGKGAK